MLPLFLCELLTDSLTRKNLMGQGVGQGFEPDVHCANGAPRESFVKITKAEDGGLDGIGTWRPVELGIRPTQESEAMKRYIEGNLVTKPEVDEWFDEED